MSALCREELERDQHAQAVADCVETAMENGLTRDMAMRCSLSTMWNCPGCPHIPMTLKEQAE